MKDMKDRIPVKNEDIVSRKILDEMLLVPIKGRLADMQRLFSLDSVAEFIWNRIDGKTDLAAIHQEMVAAYDVDEKEAEQDLNEFIAALIDAELVRE